MGKSEIILMLDTERQPQIMLHYFSKLFLDHIDKNADFYGT